MRISSVAVLGVVAALMYGVEGFAPSGLQNSAATRSNSFVRNPIRATPVKEVGTIMKTGARCASFRVVAVVFYWFFVIFAPSDFISLSSSSNQSPI